MQTKQLGALVYDATYLCTFEVRKTDKQSPFRFYHQKMPIFKDNERYSCSCYRKDMYVRSSAKTALIHLLLSPLVFSPVFQGRQFHAVC